MAKQKSRDPRKEFVVKSLAQRAAEASKDLIVHLRPIYISDSKGEPELVGTGVLIAVGSQHFLVTAAHVFDQAKGASFYIHTGISGDLEMLEGHKASSVSNHADHNDDLIDISVVWLDTTLAGKIDSRAFLSPANIDLDDLGDPTRVYIAMGYPWRKNVKINRTTRRLRPWVASYAANIMPKEDLKAAGVHSKSHLLIKYDKRHSRTETGRDMTAPHPHGMSGGPLWRYDPYGPASTTIQMVGILIEWKENLGALLAVRMPFVFAAIARLCPEVESLLAVACSVKVDLVAESPNS